MLDACTIRDCVFEGNAAARGAGALLGAPLGMAGCTVRENEAGEWGGGLMLRPQQSWCVLVRNTTVAGNKAGKDGGGIFLQSSWSYDQRPGLDGFLGGVFEDCRLYGNRAANGGAVSWSSGDHVSNDGVALRRCLIYANAGAYAVGGGVSRGTREWVGQPWAGGRGTGLTVQSCTIADNEGSGVRVVQYNTGWGGDALRVWGSIVSGNAGGLEFVDGGCGRDGIDLRVNVVSGNRGGDYLPLPAQGTAIAPGVGAAMLPPKFADAKNADLSKRDYRLAADSPLLKLVWKGKESPPAGWAEKGEPGMVAVKLPNGKTVYYPASPTGWGIVAKVEGRDTLLPAEGMELEGGQAGERAPAPAGL
jgi:hypothetical protein